MLDHLIVSVRLGRMARTMVGERQLRVSRLSILYCASFIRSCSRCSLTYTNKLLRRVVPGGESSTYTTPFSVLDSQKQIDRAVSCATSSDLQLAQVRFGKPTCRSVWQLVQNISMHGMHCDQH